MLAKGDHSIQKVFVEVNTKSKKVAEECKNTIENFLQKEVFPEIEKYFNSLEIENEVLIQQIENLNIEVNIPSSNTSINDSSTKREIKEQLITKLKTIFKEPELHEVAIKTSTVSESKLDTFFHFLQHGITGWRGQNKEKNFTKKILFEITENQSFEERFFKSLRDPIQKKRLIQQFKAEELQILFLSIFNKPKGYESFLTTIKKFGFKNHKIKNKVWDFFIKAIINNDFSRIVDVIQEEIIILKRTTFLKNYTEELIFFLEELVLENTIFKNQINVEKLKELGIKIDKKQEKAKEENIDIIDDFDKKHKKDEGINIIRSNKKRVKKTNKIDLEVNNTHGQNIINKQNIEKNKVVDEKLTFKDKEIDSLNLPISFEESDNQNKKEDLKKQLSPKEKKKEVKEELSTKMQQKSKNIYKDKDVTLKNEKALKDQKRAEYKRRHNEALKNTFLSKKEIVSEFKTHIVKNAGLILLHPFLKQFFNSCGFLNKENKIIKSNEAVHLLHYVATKKEQQFENNLIFEKFLCNLPIQSSIERNIVLSDELKEKSEELLKAVLQNWSVLKSSSNDLLRNEYLQREGKLDLTKDNPNLTVERKTQDILIDTKLPWNLSLCKLPWMKELIFTNW
ncbi:contractile injection system tape measure protein [Tenacibaculum sp. 1_MG-2023]|uniref:contractile injection system tape measure protein n=1 Tax=Tenacibaculum sp. 1_MG-2023 TaxID=3062653 RepID=UPI0026E28D6B|nr:contractile injection system tape measure protein [Tenacibaculum sp. 1_MG-2023]MDO6675258.1 contractile injection system tape measure protein [Tenacibaculum sp. 1_MG-2023]